MAWQNSVRSPRNLGIADADFGTPTRFCSRYRRSSVSARGLESEQRWRCLGASSSECDPRSLEIPHSGTVRLVSILFSPARAQTGFALPTLVEGLLSRFRQSATATHLLPPTKSRPLPNSNHRALHPRRPNPVPRRHRTRRSTHLRQHEALTTDDARTRKPRPQQQPQVTVVNTRALACANTQRM